MSGIQAKAVLKYAIMPGIIPRLRQIFASGFGHTALLMAYIYNSVRLLPDGHPYLQTKNVGKFGIRHVIIEAANHLVISKKNIDQIVIFTLLLTSVVLLVLMLGALVVGFVFNNAFAQVGSMFRTDLPQNDIAFMLMDQVFGIPNFFNSCVAQSQACFPGQNPGAFPWPFHIALQEMFRFYSSGILLIGLFIFLYFIVVIVVETATSGSPFGQRFKNMWVPVRLVVAIGLLIPLNYGYNTAQYITFAAAKYGSGFATNAWLLYNRTIETNVGPGLSNAAGEPENMIALPKQPDVSSISQMMSIVHTCAFAYWYHNEDDFVGMTNKTRELMPGGPQLSYMEYQNTNHIRPYFVKNVQSWMLDPNGLVKDPSTVKELTQATLGGSGQNYKNALDFYGRSDIIIRFGKLIDKNNNGLADDGESVEPTCGDVRIKITDPRLRGDPGVPNSSVILASPSVQDFYYQTILLLWFDYPYARNYLEFAGRSHLLTIGLNNQENDACSMGCNPENPNLPKCTAASQNNARPCRTEPIGAEWKQNATDTLQALVNARLVLLWKGYNQFNTDITLDENILKYGWGGAGIWFNKIAQSNGAFADAIAGIPTFDAYPLVMEKVLEYRKKTENDNNVLSQFDPNTSKDKPIQYGENAPPYAKSVAISLNRVHDYWNKDVANMANTEKNATTGAVETAMNMLFGTSGLFAMTSENAHIHPLAQLVALGKSLVDNAIGAVAGSTLLSAGGGLAKALQIGGGPLAEATSGLIMSTAFIGLTAGIVLYYVLPFLPFVYFYFAVGAWIKSIFEAMVGVPLWALAHLRLDGEGLPGNAAQNGYFLIFEIFLRPVISVIGLIAALVIFTAQVRILNFVWLLVTTNAGGFDGDSTIDFIGNINMRRTIIDQFFFTILYTMVVYSMAIASFKLIDKIPDNILRWIGTGASSFSDINQDATDGLTSTVALGGMQAGNTLTGAARSAGAGLGGAIGTALKGPATPP